MAMARWRWQRWARAPAVATESAHTFYGYCGPLSSSLRLIALASIVKIRRVLFLPPTFPWTACLSIQLATPRISSASLFALEACSKVLSCANSADGLWPRLNRVPSDLVLCLTKILESKDPRSRECMRCWEGPPVTHQDDLHWTCIRSS